MAMDFDPEGRSWVQNGGAASTVPPLDGELLFDETTLDRAADDFGQLVHHRPMAVLKPRSSEDIVKMVGFAREQGFKVAPRGQAKCALGQAQAEEGLVVRMSSLKGSPAISGDRVRADAGMTWRELLSTTLKYGLRPPVMAGTMYLSIGGTLSLGGFDQCTFRLGAQVDHVMELQVVTGEGKLETCSDTQLPELFNAVLAGQGQCGIILNATLPLVAAETHSCDMRLLYNDLASLLDDMRLLQADGRFDRMLGSAMGLSSGRWVYYLQVSRHFNAPELPGKEELLAGLSHLRGFEAISVLPFYDVVGRNRIPGLRTWTGGPVSLPHPWFAVALPDSTAEEFLSEALTRLSPSPVEPDIWISLYPLDTGLFSRPLLRLPEEKHALLIVIFISHRDPETLWEAVERNSRIYHRARELGGVLGTMSAIPFSREDWRAHYGPAWEPFAAAKERFDPDNVLTPGPGIF